MISLGKISKTILCSKVPSDKGGKGNQGPDRRNGDRRQGRS